MIKMSFTLYNCDINELLVSPESEFLDFKREWHNNSAKLIHDLVCLANANSQNDRFLILGIDDSGTIVGVENDANRKTQAQLIDLVRASSFNIVPTIKLKTHKVQGHEIDVVGVENKAEKPYFLNEDKVYQGTTVRSGVAYSRTGDTNTPINLCVDDKKLEEMFKERFRLDRSPSQRLTYLLSDKGNWKYYEEAGDTYFFSELFPEFKIRMRDRTHSNFSEPWVPKFPDPSVYSYELVALYFDTKLSACLAVSLDGGRMLCVVPSQNVQYQGSNIARFYYYFVNGSLKKTIKNMVDAVHPQHQQFYHGEPFNYFDSEEEAKQMIEQHWSGAGNRHLIYFEKDPGGTDYRQKFN